MSNLPPPQETESKPVEDNARKLILLQIDPEMLAQLGAKTYDMEVQWIGASDDYEAKVVNKMNIYDELDAQALMIVKTAVGGKRKTSREEIPYEEFLEAKEQCGDQAHFTKQRSEFSYVQGGVEYVMKYDEFKIGTKPGTVDKPKMFCMLEVDAETDEQRSQFDPQAFEPAQIYAEVTGNPDYTGHRMMATLQKLQR